MLEKAPEGEFGGNARFSSTTFRFVHRGPDELREFAKDVDQPTFARMVIPPYSAADFTADLLRVTDGRIDRTLMEILVEQSNAALHWTLESGMRWTMGPTQERNGKLYFSPGFILSPVGAGVGQLMQWREIALALGVEVRYESAVRGLVGNDRRVEGVRVSAPNGEYELLASSVILCSGGFQASAEMRGRYLSRNADLMKVRGSRHDTGEVLHMALAMGAQSSGQWQGAHSSPICNGFPDTEAGSKGNRYSYPYGITVNALGSRFFDEGEAESVYTYAKTGWKLLAEPGGVAFQIYDAKCLDLMMDLYRHSSPVEAESIAELAGELHIPRELLEGTIEEFNAAVREDVPFDPGKRDGRSTQGISPPKSNWAQRIDTPPYRAYAVTAGITFTFGGLKITERAEVVRAAGGVIRGLYASGDIVGLFYHNYAAGSGQTRNVVFSRLAGKHAATKKES